MAGKRAGLAGERSGLWHEFHRVLAESTPRWVLIENVPGLLSSHEGRDLAVILRGLEELGYGWAYRVLDLQYFGIPQRRRRVFIVGCLGDAARAASVLFEPESVCGNPPPRREAGEGVAGTVAAGAHPSGFNGRDAERDMLIAGTLGGGAGSRGWSPDTDRMTFLPEVAATLESHTPRYDDMTETFIPFDTTQITSKGNYSVPKAGDPSHPLASSAHPPTIAIRTAQTGSNGWGVNEDHAYALDGAAQAVAQPLRANRWGGSDSHGDEGNVVFGFANVSDGSSARSATDLMPPSTLRHGDPGSIVHGMSVRRLTPLECERLQSFEDGWTDGFSDAVRYRMLGNAVPPVMARWIGARLMLEVQR